MYILPFHSWIFFLLFSVDYPKYSVVFVFWDTMLFPSCVFTTYFPPSPLSERDDFQRSRTGFWAQSRRKSENTAVVPRKMKCRRISFMRNYCRFKSLLANQCLSTFLRQFQTGLIGRYISARGKIFDVSRREYLHTTAVLAGLADQELLEVGVVLRTPTKLEKDVVTRGACIVVFVRYFGL